jgi:hypothetical protein
VAKQRFCQHRDFYDNRCNRQLLPDEQFACREHLERPLPAPRATGSVYFVLAEATNVVKIGTAANTRKRLRALQAGSPLSAPLVLVGEIEGGVQVERWLHFHCIADRSHFEWFHWTRAVSGLVRRVLSHGYNAALSMCPQHLADDRRTAAGRPSGSLGMLPGPRSYVDEYISHNEPNVTPLDACACALCRRPQ